LDRQRVSRVVLAAFFVGAGTLHFLKPDAYEAVVVPGLPYPREIVWISGAAEIVGGLGVLSRPARPWAGWWLIALLVAVFPSNVYMAISPEEIRGLSVPPVLLWLRLPLQAVLIAWVWRATTPARASGAHRRH
jgi:uncharacterized membrane protein